MTAAPDHSRSGSASLRESRRPARTTGAGGNESRAAEPFSHARDEHVRFRRRHASDREGTEARAASVLERTSVQEAREERPPEPNVPSPSSSPKPNVPEFCMPMSRSSPSGTPDRAAQPRIALMMPALDEEDALPLVLDDLATLQRSRPSPWLDEIVVVDNGSRDRTPEIARRAGATVLHEPARGYGSACLNAIGYLRKNPPDILVFMDADHSDHAADIPALLKPLLDGTHDLVIGSRTRGPREAGALLPQARLGNWIATGWIRLKHGFRYTDLGPFRAVRFSTLERMRLADRDFGWTVEMQVRALQVGARVTEVPVAYRRRVGRSKISGTLIGSYKAGSKILSTLWRLRRPPVETHAGPSGGGEAR